MDPSKRNKKTNCSPKSKHQDKPESTTSQKKDKESVQEVFLKSPNCSSSTKSENTNVTARSILKNIINQKIQKHEKTTSELPERILKETRNDQLYYATLNARIFQSKVAYFPGKNIEDLKRVLNSTKGSDIINARLKTQNCNFVRKIVSPNSDKIFGKHLTMPRKKSRRVKITTKPLNPIQELNESEKSNESLLQMSNLSTQINVPDIASPSIEILEQILLQTIPDDDFALSKEENASNEEQSICLPLSKIQKNTVSYVFQTNRTGPRSDDAASRKVNEIRKIFENMNENSLGIPLKGFFNDKIDDEQIHFNHEITCEDCKEILKNLIGEKSGVTRTKETTASHLEPKRIRNCDLENLVEEISEDVLDNGEKINLTVKKEKKRSEISLAKNRRKSRKKKKVDSTMKHYRNFLLLAFAISIILYCFYCRLDEKKK